MFEANPRELHRRDRELQFEAELNDAGLTLMDWQINGKPQLRYNGLRSKIKIGCETCGHEWFTTVRYMQNYWINSGRLNDACPNCRSPRQRDQPEHTDWAVRRKALFAAQQGFVIRKHKGPMARWHYACDKCGTTMVRQDAQFQDYAACTTCAENGEDINTAYIAMDHEGAGDNCLFFFGRQPWWINKENAIVETFWTPPLSTQLSMVERKDYVARARARYAGVTISVGTELVTGTRPNDEFFEDCGLFPLNITRNNPYFLGWDNFEKSKPVYAEGFKPSPLYNAMLASIED